MYFFKKLLFRGWVYVKNMMLTNKITLWWNSKSASAFKEIAMSALCGLILVSAAFPEVAFLGATFRYNDITYERVTSHAAQPVNIFPVSYYRQFWHWHLDMGGAYIQSEPSMEFIRVSLQNGESPYWNPYSASGALGPETLVDNKFAIINWIYAILGGGQRVFDLIVLASAWLAIACMHRFLRGICKLPQISAWGGAVFYLLNGFVVAGLVSNVLWSYIFIPPCLLACSRLLEKPNLRRLAVTSITIAAILSFTFIPTTTISLLVTVAISLFYLWACADNKTQIIKGILFLFAAGIIAFCLVASIYFPIIENLLFDSAELQAFSDRGVPFTAHWLSLLSLFSSSHFFVSYAAFSLAEYSAYHGLGVLGNTYHLGVVAILFIAFALVVKNKARLHQILVWGCFAIAFLALLRIFGLPGYSWLIAQIPVLGRFGINYWWSGVMLPGAILVAFGLRNIVIKEITKCRLIITLCMVWSIFLALIIAVYYIGTLSPQWVLHDRQIRYVSTMIIFMVVTTVLIVLFTYAKKNIWNNILGWSLTLFLAVNLYSENKHLFFEVPDFFEKERPEVQFLQENAGLHRVLGIGRPQPVRPERSAAWGIYVIGSNNMSIMPAYENLYRNNIELYPSQRLSIFLTTEWVQDTPELNRINTFFLDITGVRYLVMPAHFENYVAYWEDQGFFKVAYFPASTVPGIKIFENPNVWPRAFWLSKDHLPIDGDRMLAPELHKLLKDVNIIHYHHAHLTMQGNAEFDGIVVLTDNWHRNWSAELNGEKAEILIVHETFRGIHVPPGDFEITMSYRPSTLTIALLLTGASFVFCLFGLVFPRRFWHKIYKKERNEPWQREESAI